MAQVRITQVRSGIGGTHRQRETLRSLGLRGIRQTTERETTPQVMGYVQTVAHLVEVTPLDETSEEASA